MLEQLGHAKEERSSLLRAKSLSNIEQVDDLRQEYPTFARTNRGFIEDARFLNDGRLVLEEDADWRERGRGGNKRQESCQLCLRPSTLYPVHEVAPLMRMSKP